MGACEIAFISILFVILLVWYFKVFYQPAQNLDAAAAADDLYEEAAVDDYADPAMRNDEVGSPTFDDQGFADGASPSMSASGASEPIGDLTPFGEQDAVTGDETGDFPEAFGDRSRTTGGVRRQKNRYARSMAAEREWQMQNARQAIDQKGLVKRNAIGASVGFQTVMDSYTGNTLPAPRRATGCHRRIGLVEGSPDALALKRAAQTVGEARPRTFGDAATPL